MDFERSERPLFLGSSMLACIQVVGLQSMRKSKHGQAGEITTPQAITPWEKVPLSRIARAARHDRREPWPGSERASARGCLTLSACPTPNPPPLSKMPAVEELIVGTGPVYPGRDALGNKVSQTLLRSFREPRPPFRHKARNRSHARRGFDRGQRSAQRARAFAVGASANGPLRWVHCVRAPAAEG